MVANCYKIMCMWGSNYLIVCIIYGVTSVSILAESLKCHTFVVHVVQHGSPISPRSDDHGRQE